MSAGPTGIVFRDDAHEIAAGVLARALRSELEAAARSGRPLLGALLRAGALEAGLCDLGSHRAPRAARLADQVADAMEAGGTVSPSWVDILGDDDRLPTVRVRRPEGFAYYALQPRVVADAARARADLGPTVTVIGIRTIGVVLSAAVRAALARGGRDVERTTVRPEGHPYDRRTRLSADQRRQIQSRAHGSFLVVDEGPGLSGSSFLSVGEALEAEGVPAHRVLFLASRVPDPTSLVAPEAARRWARFTCFAPRAPRLPVEAGDDLSGGLWRRRIFGADERGWAAAWTALERQKHLSRDGRHLFKFEGLGPFGQAIAERARVAAPSGALAPIDGPDEDGFCTYAWIAGRPATRADLDPAALARLGAYCAARAALLPGAPPPDAQAMLAAAARENTRALLGRDLPARFALPLDRATVPDGRMLPFEWLVTSEGRWIKTDAAAHGDDHLLPGPTDVAWDLAGASVEWALDEGARQVLLRAYTAASGEDPTPRLAAYEIAYAAFRAAACDMAMVGAEDGERARLLHAKRAYVAALAARFPDA